jgi:GNAT superfamily N-acetyltransferase
MTNQSIPIHQVTPDETALLTQGVTLFNDGLGAGYYDLESLRQWCTTGVIYAAVDPANGTLAGLMNAKVFGPVPDPPFEDYAQRGPVGFLKSLVVHTDYRGQRLGTRLTALTLEWMRDHGAKTFVGLSWDSGSRASSITMLFSMGFRVDKIMTAYWYQESLKHNFGCPVCGNPPCKCDAYLCSRDASVPLNPV